MMHSDYPCRFSNALKEKLMPFCLNDRLFCTLYGGLKEVEPMVALSPEEVWLEALRLVNLLRDSPRPDLGYKMLCTRLLQRYSRIVGTDGNAIEVGETQMHNTCCIVLATLLYMLATKEDATAEGLHRELCTDIARTVMNMPVYKRFYRKVRQCEDNEEKAGRYIGEKDYMKEPLPNLMPAAIDADEWVDMVIASHSPEIIIPFIYVFSHYNDTHGHSFQQLVDRLRRALQQMQEQAHSAKQVNTQGGPAIMGGTFQTGVQFNAQQLLERNEPWTKR